MKLTQIISINGVMAIALGIALAVYAPLVMTAFGIADTPLKTSFSTGMSLHSCDYSAQRCLDTGSYCGRFAV